MSYHKNSVGDKKIIIMKYELLENKFFYIVDIRAIPENDKEISFLEKYNIIEQKELDELDILKFNDELIDFIEAKGYRTKGAFNLPINNICTARVV
jgi:hypothetical protein